MEYNKIKGCIFGQAIGDALGLGTEFMSKSEVERYYPQGLSDYTQIINDHHRCRWYKGDWTDDTDMMLCILRSFVRKGYVDYKHIALNFKNWCFDGGMGIGKTTYNVLLFGDYIDNPQAAAKTVWKMGRKDIAANGGIMRTSIVGLLPDNIEDIAQNICRLTHYDPRCVGSCVIVSEIIHALVYENKLLGYNDISAIAQQYDGRIQKYIELSYRGNLTDLNLDEEQTMGYTLKTLAAALWVYWHASTFEDGISQVINAGGDADTNAAVCGAILGAKFGIDGIPKRLVSGLYKRKELNYYIKQFISVLTNTPLDDPFNLQRFVSAQQPIYQTVLSEIRSGIKTSHKIYFIFPKIKEPRSSSTSQYYGIASQDEAIAYLAHPILGTRLKEISMALLRQRGLSADEIFGEIDAMKLCSCMTLFDSVSSKSNIYDRVLKQYFNGRRCDEALKKIYDICKGSDSKNA